MCKLLCITLVIILSACSSGDDDSAPSNPPQPPPEPQITISGKVQKGEFNDLQVDVYPIDENGQFGAPLSAQINGSEYSFESLPNQIVNVRAHGTYVDEISGEERIVPVSQPLQSIFEINAESQNTPHNVNILTTITTQLWRQNEGQNNSAASNVISDYEAQQSNLAQGLGFAPEQDFAQLDITNVESTDDPSFTLLMLGGALLQQDPNGQNLPIALTNVLDLIETGVPLQETLDVFNGIDVGAVYNAIQDANIIADLPELTISDGSIFLCEPLCNIVVDLSPSVTINNMYVYEGQGKAYVRLTRTGNSFSDLTVNISVSDMSAELNKDFASIETSITFRGVNRSVDIEIDPIIDNITEGDEQLTITLSLPEGSNYALRRTSATVTIKDGMPASASLPEQLALTSSGCFVAIGLPTELLQNNSELACASSIDQGLAINPANSDSANESKEALQFLAMVDADCSDNACNGGQLWPFDVVLEAVDTLNNTVADSERLGQLLYDINQVAANDEDVISQSRFARVTADIINNFIGTATANNHALRLRLVAPNNITANLNPENIDLPKLAPAGDIRFGETDFELLAGAILTDGDTCPNEGDVRINGTYQQRTTIEGVELVSDYSGEVCAAYVQSADGGNWQVTESDIDITGEDAVLPEGAYFFAEVSNSAGQSQRITSALPLVILGSVAVTPEFTLDAFITSDDLPFGFRINGARLTENGLLVSYDRTTLLEQTSFEASDPRIQNTESNTNIYSNVSPGELMISNFGLSGTLNIANGSAKTAWPRGDINWQSFSIELIDGQLQDHNVQIDFSMEQSLDCTSVACSQGNKQIHEVSGVLHVDAQGTGIGDTQYSTTSSLSWGAFAANNGDTANAWELLSALEQNAEAIVVLPGFIQRYLPNTAENAADGLIAHRRQSAFIHNTFGPESDEFKLGNFFATGINIGPELYVDGSGQPQTLEGASLAGLDFALKNGPSQTSLQSVTSHEATKFVIQNAGVSGVINADPSAMPSAFNASGFSIDLDRFALRTQSNTNDSFNWIDGSLRLEGDAKIGMAFNNLALSCDGSLSDAQMLTEACGEQCRLDSWRADINIFNFGFSDASGEALACSSEQANLSLEHDISFKALDKNIAMRTRWNTQGQLQNSSANGQTQYRLDSRDTKAGYPIIVDSVALKAPIDLTEPEIIRYGTLEMSADIGVPFWLALESDLRLANTTSFGNTVAEATVVVPRATFDTASYQALEASLNFELQAQILEDEQFDFDARYEWGRTGFGFQLPVFYDVALANQEVSFLGRRQEIDLFVLDAGAGIDFIQPDRTKLSFGASADFAALKKVRFQVDLTNTDGLAKIDELLVQAKIVQEPIITPTFENIANAVSFVNDIAGRGLDPIMEKLLLDAVTNVGIAAIPAMPNQRDPFDTLADTMAEIKNFPNHLIAQTDQVVFDPINHLLDEQETFLRAELLSIVQDVEALDPGEQLQAPLQQKIEEVGNLIALAENQINSVFNPVDEVLTNISTQVTQIDESVEQVQAARNEVEAIFNEVTSVVATQCGIQGSVIGSESAGYLQAAFQQLNDIKGLVELLSNSDALGVLADLVVDDPMVKETINDTQDTLREGATALLTKVAEAEVALRDSLCQPGLASLTDQVRTLLQQIDSNIAQMDQLIMRVDNDIRIVQADVKNLKAVISEPLGDIQALVNDIERQINDRAANVNGTAIIEAINESLADIPQSEITTLVARQASDTDVFNVSFDFVREKLVVIRTTLVEQLKQETDGLFPYGDVSADQLRRQLVNLVMASEPVSALREELNTNLVEIIRQANSQVLVITDQANAIVQEALAKVENEANKVLEDATAPIRDIPLDSGKLDGFAVIAGNELERAHVGAEWTMSSSDESEPGNTFGAALDAVSWAANGKAEGCSAPGAESNLDVTISALGIPAKIGQSEITIKKVYLGFTLGSGEDGFAFKPIGVNGGISTTGNIGFTEFVIYDPAFAAGIGLQEVYLGAAAGAVFSDIQAEVAFLVGKTCNQDVLLELDPKVAQYIPIPETGFTGAYVRGAASVPVYTNGCPLTIGVAADIGAWILKGPPVTLGGLVGGGAYGKVGCVGALRGQIRALGQVNTDGDITFVGEGFGIAGLGLCEPAGWTSVERSRQDTFCGTADAIFTAGYIDGWSVFNLSVSAIH
ncbi:Calx-beta domain-containing protein [Glaciecola petra]|uniref:Calx-beta domain-containing protein n=1 Tax=Glaciecola petra TaxID=3075602 RepID=A0ABU2ZUI6_9ALTE|nr:Calx-beta domain-containing protein [Aestuariibacter sp. P117]MDT0595931.1 Calx-beta domain-containing protein [Aestuariibacter sp. P117]